MPPSDNKRQGRDCRSGQSGWVQVNGWRGDADTVEKINMRVEHGLYYIRNWSIFVVGWRGKIPALTPAVRSY